MTFFYASMYILELVYVLFWLGVFIDALRKCIPRMRKISKDVNGPLSFVLPWRADKNQHCSQPCCLRAPEPLTGWYSIAGVVWLSFLSAWSAPGLGLTHSSGTGMMYFGAKWNVDPIPSYDNQLLEDGSSCKRPALMTARYLLSLIVLRVSARPLCSSLPLLSYL